MPLLDLKTELKDLKFNTRAPYIVKDVNNPPVYNAFSKPIEARVDDVSRLAKMLTDTPGAKFVAKQALLQASNPQNYQSERTSLIGRVADAIGRSVISIVRTGVVTLAQAGVTGTGLRFTLQQPPYYYTDRQPGGAEVVRGGNVVQDRDTRTIYSTRTSVHSDITQNTANKNYGDDENFGKNEFRRGPKSDLRNSSINVATTRAGREAIANKGKISFVNDNDKIGGTFSDRVNLLDIHSEDKDYGTIPVLFGKYEAKGGYTGLKAFRAFIGNISDSYQASWTSQQYVGRMEQFFVYTGFSRTLSFPLTVPIFSEDEQQIVYNKVNSLVSHTAPQYINQTGIPSGVISYLRIGDYLQSAGVINSVSVSVNNDVPWSAPLKDSNAVGARKLILPQVLELQIQFTPIHERTPQYDATTIEEKRRSGDRFRYIGNSEKFATTPPAQ